MIDMLTCIDPDTDILVHEFFKCRDIETYVLHCAERYPYMNPCHFELLYDCMQGAIDVTEGTI